MGLFLATASLAAAGEHEAAKWLTKDKLNSVEWLPADITLIEKIAEEM